jgi:uncharacterized protein (DUF488 family)
VKHAGAAAAAAAAASADEGPRILTVGHSTRPVEEFVALLRAHGVRTLVDVRTVPRSRHNPQFNADALATSLAAAGIGYERAAGLGGFRRAEGGDANAGWRNAAFRGYADYMQTPAFAAELARLIERARRERIALMCAEAVPWRCHRSLIADAVLVRGVPVAEIAGPDRLRRHTLTPFARVDGLTLTYPPPSGKPTRGGNNHERPQDAPQDP